MIESLVYKSLLEELYTTPKPGLVDLHDNGSHTDMDVKLFEKSAKGISPFFGEMSELSKNWKSDLENLFLEVRQIGMRAEKKMFELTNGVNTHKGAIFTLGLLASAVGYVLGKNEQIGREEQAKTIFSVFDVSKKMCSKILQKEFSFLGECSSVEASSSVNKKFTNGEKLFLRYGERGVRGIALDGFSIVREKTLPLMIRLSKNKNSEKDEIFEKKETFEKNEPFENRRNIRVLLESMQKLNDTNVISRSSYNDLHWLQNESAKIILNKIELSDDDIKKVSAFNRGCIARNISPGGSADILSATLFLFHLIENGIVILG
ncbi:MAG: triphosphoribosyl-dephospho-CoA synthase [Treponema sp.]|nr:triphosphoribosyl-dephospho-CoA synthase [Treponema sp.]